MQVVSVHLPKMAVEGVCRSSRKRMLYVRNKPRLTCVSAFPRAIGKTSSRRAGFSAPYSQRQSIRPNVSAVLSPLRFGSWTCLPVAIRAYEIAFPCCCVWLDPTTGKQREEPREIRFRD